MTNIHGKLHWNPSTK